MKLRDVFVRNKRSSALLERFLIANVTSVVVIRFYLAVTGYPQFGGKGLHISHMLWGGLGMLVALVLSLAFLGRRVQSIAAILGGIGFGVFIDELGKFITSDNNYFFRPTLALIYIIFVVLLLIFRMLESPPYTSEKERLANALNILQEEALHNLHEQDREEILLLLRAHDSQKPHLNLLTDAVERIPVVPDAPLGLLEKMARVIDNLCQRLVNLPRYATTITIIIFLIGYVLLFTLLTMVFGIMNLAVDNLITGVVKIGWFASSFLSYIMILIGMLSLRRSRLTAYTWFKRSILMSIF